MSTIYINGRPQPMKYRVTLSQTGANAPTVTSVLENTLGATPSYVYQSAGIYRVEFAPGTLPFGRTFFDMKYVDPSLVIDWATPGESIIIFCSTNQDDLLFDTPFEIEVYPPTI